jgi:hypothetical protein
VNQDEENNYASKCRFEFEKYVSTNVGMGDMLEMKNTFYDKYYSKLQE